MLVIAAAAIAISPAGTAPRATEQARATVTIVRAARLRFDGKPQDGTPSLRSAKIRTAEGLQPARLIEFE